MGRKVGYDNSLGGDEKLTVGQGPATVNFPPPGGKKPDAVHTLQTTKEAALLYRHEYEATYVDSMTDK